MLKNVLLNLLKVLITGALIAWLVRSGKLDFRLLASLLTNPVALLTGFFLTILNVVLTSVRLRNILKVKSQQELPLGGMIRVNWIGQFFSSIIPGSVSGDVIKVLYLQRLDQSFTKKFIFASILVDRIVGLCGLIVLVGVSSVFYTLRSSEVPPVMQQLININYILTALVFLGFIAFYTCHQPIRKLLEKLPLLKNLVYFWDYLGLIRAHVLKAAVLSIFIQFMGVLIFWSLAHQYSDGEMNFLQTLTLVPMGLITLALPIAPSGLGVGHVIFQKLFELNHIHNGASLFNLFFVVTLVVNLLGAVPYVLTKNKNLRRVDV
ncbi:MAG TPA: lysylphosphatidylglycerol synthase transmembrane domain-containing protein [Bacteriovoracaceae bacterium]|nr:lysylphosphatidylglycerol synthase transmembrane domain-containing protein [Bacteriovoracaceae bacterium]